MSGRQYDARDSKDGQQVAIVNQAFANRFFPMAICSASVSRLVVKSRKVCAGRLSVWSATFARRVLPTKSYLRSTCLCANSRERRHAARAHQLDPLALAKSVRSEVLAIDKNQPIYDVKTLGQRVDEAVAVSRSLMVLFAAFALLALVLGAVGIYGIVSYSVTQRTHEIGIRMALGARAANVLSLIMKNGLMLVLTGIVIGIGSALG